MAVADKTTVCSEKQNCVLESTNCEAFYAVVCAGKAKACLKVAVTTVENDFGSVWVCVADVASLRCSVNVDISRHNEVWQFAKDIYGKRSIFGIVVCIGSGDVEVYV